MLRIFVLILLGLSSITGETARADIERLTWAGIKWVSGDTTVFVDAVATDLWGGQAPEGFVAATADTGRRYALVTHVHNDHFDAAGLKQVLGERGYVIAHESDAAYIASRGLRVIPAREYVPVRRGGFVFTALPAQDGFGDRQVSWIVSDGESRILHAGDTLWHGNWDTYGIQYGPFDAVFLPINGARVGDDEVAAVMTPPQAVEAAIKLRAAYLVPIHYGLNDPPNYVEFPDALAELLDIAARRDVATLHLRPGQTLKDVAAAP